MGNGGEGKKLTASEERRLVQTVPQDGKRYVTKAREHDDDGDPNGKRVEVILVVQTVEKAGQEVVEHRDQPGGADSIISSYVTAYGDLLGEVDAGTQELPEEWCYGATSRPVSKWVEYQLIATEGILLPTRQLVIYCQGHAFLEAVAGVRGKAAAVTGTLESKRHIKILRNVVFRPELFVAVVVMIRSRLLHGRPAQDGIVADERNGIADRDCIGDGGVDEIGKPLDTFRYVSLAL